MIMVASMTKPTATPMNIYRFKHGTSMLADVLARPFLVIVPEGIGSLKFNWIPNRERLI